MKSIFSECNSMKFPHYLLRNLSKEAYKKRKRNFFVNQGETNAHSECASITNFMLRRTVVTKCIQLLSLLLVV